jgi:hypothetical protein
MNGVEHGVCDLERESHVTPCSCEAYQRHTNPKIIKFYYNCLLV